MAKRNPFQAPAPASVLAFPRRSHRIVEQVAQPYRDPLERSERRARERAQQPPRFRVGDRNRIIGLGDQYATRQAREDPVQVLMHALVFRQAARQIAIGVCQLPAQPSHFALQMRVRALERGRRLGKRSKRPDQGQLIEGRRFGGRGGKLEDCRHE